MCACMRAFVLASQGNPSADDYRNATLPRDSDPATTARGQMGNAAFSGAWLLWLLTITAQTIG